MRSLGDVSARPFRALRHPEKGPEKGHFWESAQGLILGQFGETVGEGKKGPKKGQKLYIYSY